MSRFLRLSTGFRRAFLRFQDRNLQGLGGLSYYKRFKRKTHGAIVYEASGHITMPNLPCFNQAWAHTHWSRRRASCWAVRTCSIGAGGWRRQLPQQLRLLLLRRGNAARLAGEALAAQAAEALLEEVPVWDRWRGAEPGKPSQ